MLPRKTNTPDFFFSLLSPGKVLQIYLKQSPFLKLPELSDEKKKAGVFDGPQIRTLMKNKSFVLSMNDTEKNACNAFVKVTKEFLGNKKSENYIEIVNNLMDKLQRLKINMSIKVHLLFNHLEDFPENLGAVSDEQGERFHQDIRVMEVRYQGR